MSELDRLLDRVGQPALRRGAIDAIAAFSESAPPRVLICGSLYLAGMVLDRNGTPPR